MEKGLVDFVSIMLPYYYEETGKVSDVKASLYGIDIILSKDGKCFINEINGCNSGMKGFKQVYGDNRVEEKVFDMLSSLGDLAVNDGTFEQEKRFQSALDYCKKHPVLTYLKEKKAKLVEMISSRKYKNISEEETDAIAKIDNLKSVLKSCKIWSDKLDIDWLFEKAPKMSEVGFPFKRYSGQESLVLNVVNDYISHPTVNSFVQESVAGNKFLQYMLLRDAHLPIDIPKTTIVGLGVGDRRALEDLIYTSGRFVRKPLSASCGVGVKFIGKEDLAGYVDEIGPIRESGRLESVIRMLTGMMPLYVEDLASSKNFNFEIGMHVIQPFIDSKSIFKKGCYSTIRAMVCNGKFVDAYMRYSPNPKVNLAQDANATSFKDESLGKRCEDVVRVFNERCDKLTPYNFRSKLYKSWFDEVGRTSVTDKYMQLIGFEKILVNFVSMASRLYRF